MVMESLARLLGPLASGCVVHGAWYCPALDLQALASLALVPMDLSYSLLWDHLLLRAAAFFWMSYVLVPVSPSPRTTPLAILAACAPAALLLLLGIALLGVSTAEHIMTFRFVVTLALRTRPLALAIFQSHCQRLSPPWCFVRAKLTITASPCLVLFAVTTLTSGL
ncbi:hypothetical protein BGZ61DRAFT_91045 [Ilyonectria robusta]|uniref:uncharacterized protein n=1 Tax=Ilyonectria robusta TaxID=1079257 RepID=UPI001E8CB088|nr:uncharacterized protein BGZ61DRAFT_91045 [Ilyonectria robusta]KAH8736052.1 hypothetical protein BGZ61DRAFT_91045 [Ilyonectria robusta]